MFKLFKRKKKQASKAEQQASSETFQQVSGEFKKGFSNVLHGRGISNELFVKHFWNVLIFLLLTIIYISNRYSCQHKIAEINTLRKELRDAKYEALSLSAEFTQKMRREEIQRIANEQNLALEPASEPPYKID